MADPRKSAYGAAAGGPSDTSFRRTWDREEYAAKAAARAERERAEGRARHEARLAGKKYVAPGRGRRGSTPPDARATEARRARLDVAAQVGKTQLVAAAAAVGKRGKGAGFYCPDCDLTFKDNVAYVEHLNSRQHLVAVGQTGEVERAGAAQVRERLRWLWWKGVRERAEEGDVDLGKRVEDAVRREEKEREEKRRKRNEKRRKRKGGDDDVPAWQKVENDGFIY
ncbi:hypothetical protein BDY21DRAFT_370921 [Lineolata rhizophorae]|uniref:C2H2-type domain-containing protein n=1 Tax=Lineolata rhizophorae TaxID=578093 RepID=A0A6A6P4S0_9PEZI|nr:hypothetical protein BDY21DRAFT_370921 [Lineolata rhizophorae]